MNYFIIIFFILFCGCCLKFRYNNKKKKVEKFSYQPINFTQIKNTARKKVNSRKSIYGRPNKCFSCEKEMIKTGNEKNIHQAFPSKCFSCEKESKNPYMEGSTKCFSCD
jgi:hypothetical protein